MVHSEASVTENKWGVLTLLHLAAGHGSICLQIFRGQVGFQQ